MPVVPVNLNLDDETYTLVLNGTYEICGMVKDKNLKRIRKHLPVVIADTKDGISKAAAVVKERKDLIIKAGIGVAVFTASAGTIAYILEKDKRKAKKNFAKSLTIYLDAAKNGTLTTEIIETLLADLETYANHCNTQDIPLKLTAKQLFTIFYSIFEYTQNLAVVNNIPITDLKTPKILRKNNVIDLQYYLEKQKDILNKIA